MVNLVIPMAISGPSDPANALNAEDPGTSSHAVLDAVEREVSIFIPPASKKERKWMLKMGDRLQPYVALRKPPLHKKSTLRKYYYRFINAQKKCGNGYLGLIRHIADRGNGNSKADTRSTSLAKTIIETEHLTPTKSKKIAAYRIYLDVCKNRHLFPISETWFKELISRVPLERRVEKREGKRRAYAHERGTGPRFLDPDRNGGRVLARAHIDATEIPVELLCRYTGIHLGKAKLLAMIDSYCLRVLAYLITFQPSTRGLVLALIRLSAQRYKVIPRELVIDKGPDLQSIDVRLLAAQANCTIIDRRTRKGKDGRPAEAFFGACQAMLWPNIAGNTQNSKDPRAMSAEVDPKAHTVHTIDSLDDAIAKFLLEEYDTHPIGALAASPGELFEYSKQQHGLRGFTPIANDRNLLIATSPTARPVTSAIDPRRGILLAPLEYWSDRFMDVSTAGRRVERKRDFLNGSRIFAALDNEWIDATASPHPQTSQMSSRELHYLTEEYKRRYHRALELSPNSDTSLGEFLAELREEETSLKKLLQFRADKSHLDQIFGSDCGQHAAGEDTHSPLDVPQPTKVYKTATT